MRFALLCGGIGKRLKVRLATKLVRTDDLRSAVKLRRNPRSEIVQAI